MPCVALPTVSPTSLPSPFSIPELVVAPIGLGELELCCKLPPIATPPIPIPIPGAGLLLQVPGAVDVLTAAVDVVIGYLNSLPLKCPLE